MTCTWFLIEKLITLFLDWESFLNVLSWKSLLSFYWIFLISSSLYHLGYFVSSFLYHVGHFVPSFFYYVGYFVSSFLYHAGYFISSLGFKWWYTFDILFLLSILLYSQNLLSSIYILNKYLLSYIKNHWIFSPLFQ